MDRKRLRGFKPEAIIFDTETTGKQGTQLIEAAWISADRTGPHYVERFKPSVPITCGARAVHHILDEDLVDCRSNTEFKLPEGFHYMIGHNVDFDWEIAGKPECKLICTVALSRWLFPDGDSHSLGAMMYRLFEPVTAKERLKNAHSALHDVLMTWDILDRLIEIMEESGLRVANWECLWEYSEEARVPTVMSFGKHSGEKISEIPLSYIHWYMKQTDRDPYLVKAFNKRLGR